MNFRRFARLRPYGKPFATERFLMLRGFILAVHVLLALMIIGLVLLQRGKGAEAGAGFGSGASGNRVRSARHEHVVLEIDRGVCGAVFRHELVAGLLGDALAGRTHQRVGAGRAGSPDAGADDGARDAGSCGARTRDTGSSNTAEVICRQQAYLTGAERRLFVGVRSELGRSCAKRMKSYGFAKRVQFY